MMVNMKIQFVVLHITVGLSYQSCTTGATREIGCVKEKCTGGKWIPDRDDIQPKCKTCHAYGDPHFETFSGAKFAWFSGCNYALVQSGSSMNPEFGVFMKFERRGTASYIGSPTTYQENANTKVVLNPSNLFNVAVNGHNQEIGDSSTPTQLIGPSSTPSSVYAWRHKDIEHSNIECLRLYGKTQILVELCKSTIHIWAPSEDYYPVTLGGFCGRTDNTAQLIGRDGQNHGNPGDFNNIAPEGFGNSWQTPHQDSNCRLAGRRKRSPRKQRSIAIHTNCVNGANMISGDHHDKCMGVHDGPIGDDHLSACKYDLCIVNSDPGHAGLTESWMLNQHIEVHGRRKIHNHHHKDSSSLSELTLPTGIITAQGTVFPISPEPINIQPSQLGRSSLSAAGRSGLHLPFGNTNSQPASFRKRLQPGGSTAQGEVVPILVDERDGPNADGSYSFNFETDDGTFVQEQGYQKASRISNVVKKGTYWLTYPDGTKGVFKWIADENGFRVESPLLPTPPPNPPHAQNLLVGINQMVIQTHSGQGFLNAHNEEESQDKNKLANDQLAIQIHSGQEDMAERVRQGP